MKWRSALLVAALATLAGCGPLLKSDEPAASVYTLKAPAAPALTPRLHAVLAVARPLTAPGLASDRVAVALPDGRFDSYGALRWAAPVPELVESLLIDTLRARGGFAAVLLEGTDFGARYLLQPEVREFTALYAVAGRPPMVRVTLVGQLVRSQGRELIGSFSASGESEAHEDRQRAVVAAFETALGIALARLTEAMHAAAVEAEATATR